MTKAGKTTPDTMTWAEFRVSQIGSRERYLPVFVEKKKTEENGRKWKENGKKTRKKNGKNGKTEENGKKTEKI